MKTYLTLFFLTAGMFLTVSQTEAAKFDKTFTVPAEDPQGVTITLPRGRYTAELSGGAIALFFPIHPEYQWLYSLSLGIDTTDSLDTSDLGTIYFQPQPKVFTQTSAEEQALKALEQKQPGTFLEFTLDKKKELRLWVNDFDYSDNMGSQRVRVYKKK